MDFFNLGDHITVKDLNAITYLLRKFKRLNTGLRLGALTLESDYGSFSFDKPLTSVGGNFILEQAVNISSSDCLKNCFYSFVFSVIDVNTSGTVNKRQVKVTGGTGDDGTLFVTLPTDLIESDEVILPVFELDIVFDEHEYYTPVVDVVNVELVSDKRFVTLGEVATVTATLTDRDGDVLADTPCNFVVNGVTYSKTTDENGEAEWEYTGTGEYAKIDIRVITTVLTLYDTPMNAVVTGSGVSLGANMIANGDILIDWGDGTTSTRQSGDDKYSTHNYTDGQSKHTIAFIGEITNLGLSCFFGCAGLKSITIPSSVTSLGNNCFSNCTSLTSISIPDSVVSLGEGCFWNCMGLTSVTIPSSVTSVGNDCFYNCFSLDDYQLYWLNDAIIQYISDTMPVQSNTVFTIPYGQTSNYVAKNYPSAKIVERASGKTITVLTISSSKSSYYTDESVTITGALVDENDNSLASTSVKIYQNNVLLDTLTTDSDGEFTKTLTGLNVGAYTFKAVYDGDSTYEASTSSNLNITVQNHTYSLSIASDKQSILTTESVIINGQLLKDSSAFTGQSVVLYDGATIVDTLTTDGSGNYSKTLTGLSVGVHTFKAVNANAESSTISITVNEPTHTYSLSIASDKSSILTTESVIISGQLLMDSSPYTGQSVALYDGSSLVDTLTTDSDGEYEKTLTGLSVGTHSFKAVNSNAESSTVTVTVTEPQHDYSLSVASTKDILSYADSESATITATLTDNGSAVAGETLSYVIKHGTTTITTGSDTTDSSGQISFNYSATGIGDVTVEVSFGILLQEIYEVIDYWAYDTLTVDKQKYSITSGSATMTYSNDGLYIKGTVSTDTPIASTITVPVEYTAELDCDFNGNANYSSSVVFDDLNTVHTGSKLEVYYVSTNTKIKTINVNVSKTGTLKVKRTGTSMEIYWNDTLLDTITGISSTGATGFRTYNNRQATFKNLRIKAL